LKSALAAVLVPTHAPELQLVHRWLDTWSGFGAIAAGMRRAGWDLSSPNTATATGGRRSTSGQAHSIVGGSAWEATPWRAVQLAAWDAMRRPDAP